MAELRNYTAGNRIEVHSLDISYKDEIGAAEILEAESSYMFTTDGSVDLNVCSVSDKGKASVCLDLN